MRARKYRNEPDGWLMGPQTSPWIQCSGGGSSVGSCHYDGRLIILLWMHASQGATLLASVVVRMWPAMKGSILRNIVVPGCPSLLCHIYERVVAVRYRLVFRARLGAFVLGPLSRMAKPTSSSGLGPGLIALMAISYRPFAPTIAVAKDLCPLLSTSVSSSFSISV